jgi:4-carboxymuconolactone decarboxylase
MPPINRKKIHDAKVAEAHKTLFDEGIAVRRSVAGDSYVDASLKRHSTTFSKPLQDLVTEVGWGWIWTRPGLDRKQRSLLNLGMLCALNRSTELGVHVRGGLRNGLSEEEIREALLQVGVYVGLPACKICHSKQLSRVNDAQQLKDSGSLRRRWRIGRRRARSKLNCETVDR